MKLILFTLNMTTYIEKFIPYLKDNVRPSWDDFQRLYEAYKQGSLTEKSELFTYLETQKIKVIKFISQTNPIDPFYVRDVTLDYSQYKGESFLSNSQATELLGYLLNFWFEDNDFDWGDIYKARQDTIKHFVDKGFNVNALVIDDYLLHLCAKNCDVELMQFLTKPQHEPNVNKLNLNHESILISSLAGFENLDMLSFLLTLPDIDPKVGINVLTYCFNKEYHQAANMILNSSLLDNDFIRNSLKDYHVSSMRSLVEQYFLDKELNLSPKTGSKLKL